MKIYPIIIHTHVCVYTHTYIHMHSFLIAFSLTVALHMLGKRFAFVYVYTQVYMHTEISYSCVSTQLDALSGVLKVKKQKSVINLQLTWYLCGENHVM